MRASRRSGFTLVELLVVITIIGMLMALAFPAFSGIIANAKKAECASHMTEVAKAIQVYVTGHSGEYPGYSNPVRMRSGTQDVSWAMEVYSELKKNEYESIRQGTVTQIPYDGIFVCPVDSKQSRDAPLSFVANCGMKDSTTGNSFPDLAANGVFHRKPSEVRKCKDVRFTSNDIKDALSRTILLTENIQAGTWWKGSSVQMSASQTIEEPGVGAIWWYEKSNPELPQPDTKMINRGKEDTPDPNNVAQMYNYARPSSNHQGGVNVVFTDASSRFISDRVNYVDVYVKLMTPSDKGVKEAGSNQPLPARFLQPLNEADLE